MKTCSWGAGGGAGLNLSAEALLDRSINKAPIGFPIIQISAVCNHIKSASGQIMFWGLINELNSDTLHSNNIIDAIYFI